MEEQFLFDRIHDALDIEPPAGAYERLRTSLTREPASPHKWPALQTRWSRMGFRFTAGVALVALAVAITAAIFAIHSASSNSAPAAPPSAPRGGPVPAQLDGAWKQVAEPSVVIILTGTNYALSGGGLTGAGKVAVNGSEIDFYNGSACSIALPGGIGKYRWTISAGVLAFTPLNSDPCPRDPTLADPKGWQPISSLSPA
jgi:hypothetical protein